MISEAELYGPFRPRRARVVALTLAVLTLTGLGSLAAFLPMATGVDVRALDRLLIAGFAVALAWFCWRQASVAALPDADGLTVRNLFLSRRLEWAEIVSVRFGDRPWVQLDLSEGDTLAVMGIQRADGAFARTEASRLATLVALHEGHH